MLSVERPVEKNLGRLTSPEGLSFCLCNFHLISMNHLVSQRLKTRGVLTLDTIDVFGGNEIVTGISHRKTEIMYPVPGLNSRILKKRYLFFSV